MQTPFTDAITSARQELAIEIVCSPQQMLEAKQVRYQVYCEERGFEAGRNGVEQDEYDGRARHVLVRSTITGRVFGTVRAVLAPDDAGQQSFPMQRVCQDFVLPPAARSRTAEVSRFALLRDRSGVSPAAAALMRLCLMQGIIRICGDVGLTHLCAMMEQTLLRLLRSSSIYFVPVGPTVEYRGTRQPAIWNVPNGLERARQENPVVWSFLTLDGELWPEIAESAAPARRLAY